MTTVREAQCRHAAHYKNILNSADKLYVRGGGLMLRGLAFLDAEMENVRAAFTWCARNSKTDRIACLLSAEFAFAGAYILEARLHPKVYLCWLEDSISAARRTGNRLYEAAFLTNKALCQIALSQASLSVPILEQALLISREIHDRRGEGIVLDALGSAYSSLGLPDRALEQMQLGVAIKRELGDRIGEATAWANIACIHKRSGDARRAIELYEEWLPVIRTAGDFKSIALAAINLGESYLHVGRVDDSLTVIDEARLHFRALNDRKGECSTICCLAKCTVDARKS